MSPRDKDLITVSGMVPAGALRIRVPRIRARVGRAGYVGAVNLYDPRNTRVNLVQDDDTAPEAEYGVEVEDELAEEEVKPKRKVRKFAADKQREPGEDK